MSAFSLSEFAAVAEGIYCAVAEPDGVNIGLVVGADEALVIDTGSSPEQGAEIRRAAERVAQRPVGAAVVTHWHYDHLFGLAAFTDVDTYGHETVAAWLNRPECHQAAHTLAVNPATLVAPSRTFSLAATRDLGGRRVELVHFGRGHTDGDVVVIVPESGVIFAGDLLEQGRAPAFGTDSHLKEWPSAIDGILGLLAEDTIVVPGHGELVDRIFAFTQRAEISALYGQAEHLVTRGVRQESAWEAGEWPFDEATIRGVLPLAYAQLAVEGKVPRTTLPLA